MSAANLISCGNLALPRELDVRVSVSKPTTEKITDLSRVLFVQNGGTFEHGANRLAWYLTLAGVEADARVTAEGKKAARDFFAQPKRPKYLGIAQAYSTAQAGFLRTGAVAAAALNGSVSNGSFAITVDGSSRDVTALDLTGITTIGALASALQVAIRAGASAPFTTVTVTAYGTNQLTFKSGTTGDASLVSVLGTVSPAAGTDISGSAYLNGAAGAVVPGYLPVGLVGELAIIAEAARCGGAFVHGWALDKFWRDSVEAEAAAGWAQAGSRQIGLTSNSPLAWDAGSSSDIGPALVEAGLYRSVLMYHDNAEYYPEVAALAILHSVNYAARKSTLTLKFKNLVGIPTVGLRVDQYGVLKAKGYNVFTLTGNTSRMVREGATPDPTWYADEVVTLDNFAEELSAAEFNVFLTNDSVGQDSEGVALRSQPLATVCERYVTNGALSPRLVSDPTNPNGFYEDPAYTIESAPLQEQTVADRADRVGTPFTIRVNLRGSTHSTNIQVNAVA